MKFQDPTRPAQGQSCPDCLAAHLTDSLNWAEALAKIVSGPGVMGETTFVVLCSRREQFVKSPSGGFREALGAMNGVGLAEMQQLIAVTVGLLGTSQPTGRILDKFEM